MAEKQLEILRGYELRLLRCTLAPPPSDLRIQSQPLNEESQCSILPLHEHINSLINSIESGHYLQALSSDEAKHALDTLDFVDINDSAECADRVYSELLQLVKASIVNDSEIDVDKACRVILLMCLSIAALFWFTQCNVTGLFSDSGWDMAPYIEATDSQQSSYFIQKFFCDLLRIRWECTRSRTKGRALEMMDKLVEGICNSSPGVTQSIPFCYVICVPTIPALRKEYAKLLVSCGLIGEAIKNFEDLELWDSLILQLARDVEKALDGFTRAVQLDPDNGEAWNNIACLYALFFVVRSESSADMWGLYARWLKSKGDLTMCSEALLKQVRSYQGSDLWKERDRFERFSHASLELCKVYMEISSSSGSRQELFAAEMHLKNVLKQDPVTVSLCMHLFIHAENLGHSFSTLNPPNSSTA
ncbi:TPR REGION domain-containing protein [Citrus sinensis]|nr:TPR REGION domain-containing protein [Citrus sinensis]